METHHNTRYFLLPSLRWIPRILCILFAVFITLFSLDVFDEHTGLWKTLAAFLIHNIPTIFLIAILIPSWKWPWIGGVFYIALGFIYLFGLPGIKYLLIYLPLFVIGTLFLLDWFLRKKY
jgi:hypothetical protein